MGGSPKIPSTLKGDLLLRRGPKHKHGPKMVRFGPADLWTSAPGVERVQRSEPLWSRDRPRPRFKSIICRSNFNGKSRFRRSTLKEVCIFTCPVGWEPAYGRFPQARGPQTSLDSHVAIALRIPSRKGPGPLRKHLVRHISE